MNADGSGVRKVTWSLPEAGGGDAPHGSSSRSVGALAAAVAA